MRHEVKEYVDVYFKKENLGLIRDYYLKNQ